MKTLEITSYIGCPNMCHYCPQKLLKSEYVGVGVMTLDDFGRMLDNVPKDVRIDFSGFSEIFFHPQGSELIRASCTRGYNTILYTTLEGFDIHSVDILKGLSFGEVVFHQWPRVDLEEFNRKIKIFTTEIQDGRVAEITPQWEWSRAGNVKERKPLRGKFNCLYAAKDFNHNVLLPNGDVHICCQDYGLKHKIGNLLETNFDDLDRSGLVELSNQEDSDIICRKCELFQKIEDD